MKKEEIFEILNSKGKLFYMCEYGTPELMSNDNILYDPREDAFWYYSALIPANMIHKSPEDLEVWIKNYEIEKHKKSIKQIEENTKELIERIK